MNENTEQWLLPFAEQIKILLIFFLKKTIINYPLDVF